MSNSWEMEKKLSVLSIEVDVWSDGQLGANFG